MHRNGDFVWPFEGQTDNGGAGAAEETANRSGFFAGADDGVEFRDERQTIRLVQAIVEEPAKAFVAFGGESRGDEGRAIQGVGSVGFGECMRNEAAGFFGFNAEVRNECDDFEFWRNGEANATDFFADAAGNGAAAEKRR